MNSGQLRIAIACSGLGHVHRGIEAWAEDLARGLFEAGADVRLFRGAGPPEPWAEVIPTLRRNDRVTRRLHRFLRLARGWRYGCGSPYEIEQTTFSLGLWRKIRRDFDVLHVQDTVIASHLTRLHRYGLSKPKVVVGNGMGESPTNQRRYVYVQNLTPAQFDAWQPLAAPGQQAFLVPNFVDTDRFHPCDRRRSRDLWKVPDDSFVVLAVAALRSRYKRIDYLIKEFAAVAERLGRPALLVLAGGREPETDQILALAKSTLGDKVRCLEDVDRGQIHTLYPVADVFTIPALNEVFGIAFLEAMACGIPTVAHNSETMQWVCGPPGFYGDLGKEGGLAEILAGIAKDQTRLARAGEAARLYVQEKFSKQTVIPQMIQLYTSVKAHA